MTCILYLQIIWDRTAELDTVTIDVRATEKIVIAHPLGYILRMAFIRLDRLCHDSTLLQQVRKPGHIQWIEHVDFEEEPVADLVPVEWDPFHQGDMRNKGMLAIERITAIARGECMVNREMEPVDV